MLKPILVALSVLGVLWIAVHFRYEAQEAQEIAHELKDLATQKTREAKIYAGLASRLELQLQATESRAQRAESEAKQTAAQRDEMQAEKERTLQLQQETEARRDQCESELSMRISEMSECSQKREICDAELSEKVGEVDECSEKRGLCEQEFGDASREIAGLRQRANAQDARVKKMEENAAILNDRIAGLQEDLANLETENELLQQKMEQLKEAQKIPAVAGHLPESADPIETEVAKGSAKVKLPGAGTGFDDAADRPKEAAEEEVKEDYVKEMETIIEHERTTADRMVEDDVAVDDENVLDADEGKYQQEEQKKASAVVLMAALKENLEELKLSLLLLERNFLSCFSYPVFFFLGEGFTADELDNLKSLIPSAAGTWFEEMCFENCSPRGYPSVANLTALLRGRSFGYASIQRFVVTELFKWDTVTNFDYYLYMEPDVFLMDPILHDPFLALQENNCRIGFGRIIKSTAEELKSLVDEFDRWSKERGVDSSAIMQFVEYPATNRIFPSFIEFGRSDIWDSSADADSLISRLDQTIGFYEHHWKSGAAKAFLLPLMVSSNEICSIRPVFPYQHKMLPTEDQLQEVISRQPTCRRKPSSSETPMLPLLNLW